MTTKVQSSIRLTEDAKQLRKLISDKLGLSESAVVELAIRRLAELEGVKVKQNNDTRSALNV